MRRVPVVHNLNQRDVVGWLYLDDKISDEEVVSCAISWNIQSPTDGLYEAVLVPKSSSNDYPE